LVLRWGGERMRGRLKINREELKMNIVFNEYIKK